ncbi:MAG: hypothetical protein NDP13_06865 [Crenarchaeota archaeon]|nr:hypothetical protein [Thermoproteota archaeon]
MLVVGRFPWYRLALERLGIEYEHQKFGMRNRVRRFFRYLRERTIVFHNKLSARNHIQGTTNLNIFLKLFTLYYQTINSKGGQECLFGHYRLVYRDRKVYGVLLQRVLERDKPAPPLLFSQRTSLFSILYKKIILGRDFNLSPFRKILEKRLNLDQNTIDNEWRI